MLFTNARVVPHIARACFVSFFGAIVTAPSAMAAVTSLLTTRRNVPRLPLALRVCPEICTSTPLGTATGCLPTRDIAHLRTRGRGDDGLPRPLPVADPRQHVPEGIAHRHRPRSRLPARLDHAGNQSGRGELP